MEMNMIYQRAHHYTRISGEPFEDLVHEGVIANIEAELDYDPYLGAMSTHIWWCIERRLRAYCKIKARRRIVYTDCLPELETHNDTDLLELLEGAPHDIIVVCEMILSQPHEFCLPKFACWRKIKDTLVEDYGWSRQRARETLADCKQWFRANHVPLLRTNPPPPTLAA